MRKSLLAVLICLIVFSATTSGQELDRDDMKINFMEGESWLLFEEYADALPYYMNLLKEYPNNDNYNYRVGMCYLNILSEKDKAISYLEKAVQNINPGYREGSIKEEQAPPDAYFYLGHAYRINNQLDDAIKAFREFKKILDPKVYDEQVVDYQIEACNNAKRLQKEPLFVDYINLGDPINSRFNDFNPVVSGDESAIVFTRAMQFMDVLMYSKKVNGKWTEPLNMTEMLGYDVDDRCYSTSLSNDGTVAYIYKNDEYDGNIYISKLSDGIWSPLEKLNANINTKYWESHACISRDGRTLYFTSNRKGGKGDYDLDIYMSERDSTGDWGPAVNLGTKINTPYNEETPFISDDGKTLYFSSYGHLNIGGYDICYSNLLENGEWSTPLNMGIPINTTDDDLFFSPAQNGIYGYYAHLSDEGLGLQDIFRYEIYSDEHPRKFHVNGVVPLDKVAGPISGYKILVIGENGDTLQVIKPDPVTGEYNFDVIAGKYKIVFENEGYETITENISFDKNQPNSDLNMSTPVLALTDLVADMKIDKTFFEVNTDDPVLINLTLEPGSELDVESFINNSLLNEDGFKQPEEKFTYPYNPSVGKNIVRFSLTDKFGNITTEEVIVDYIPIAKPEVLLVEVDSLTEDEGSLSIDRAITILDNFAEGDLEKALEELRLLAAGDLEKALDELRKMATGDLKAVLDSLDLKTENITTSGELVDYLIEQEADNEFTNADVVALVVQYGEQEWKKTTDLYRNLQKFATGNLKKALDELDVEGEGIYTADQLYRYLVNHAEELGYSKDDLMTLLIALAVNGNMQIELFLKRLSEVANDNLARLLDDLDLEEQNINTIDELIAYLFNSAEQYGMTEEEIIQIILELSAREIYGDDVTQYLASLEEAEAGKGFPRWVLWTAIPVGLILIFLVLWNRREKKK